ncbi:hypothetical protein [Pseudomonas sp. KBW05]|uniref:hypothetical protein n=1 Tax=Pseudomonas sp. KBW05 TaxID=2153360 RepID=UPI0013150519|nr:hypothetical protein [Pseudomonas sp. KBW05]
MLPEEISFKTRTLLKIAVSAPGAFVIGGATALMFRQWPTDNAAAWVQAVGSIGAIIGAFMVATHTHKLERRASKDAGLDAEVKAVLLAEGIVKEASETFSAVCRNANRSGETRVSSKRIESVHQALMLAISQPVSEQALKPVLKTLRSVSDASGILQDAMAHQGVLRSGDQEKLNRHMEVAKASKEILSEVLAELYARRKRSK